MSVVKVYSNLLGFYSSDKIEFYQIKILRNELNI